MQFSTLITFTTTLALGTNAAVMRRADPPGRLAQFRIFGADGCHDLNYGFYTVDDVDANTCHSDLGEQPVPIESVNLEVLYAAAEGCVLSIYTDSACTEGAAPLAVNTCQNSTDGVQDWKSWQISCPASS
ncbi:hypothetical protein GGR57DRAFT_473604 [Xylariaceae sp. FL1272]|nr:hypothetical protein GGR57DRAFT_473604 [Xylariaceae sp. FL1272]